MSFVLFLLPIVCILGQETTNETNSGELENQNQKLLAQLTACWVISIQELSESQAIINQYILTQTGKSTRDNVFYKIQTTMLEQCIQQAPKEELETIMKSISEDVKQYKSFKEIIPNFDYNQFNSTTFEWQFTKTDETLMKYIRRFEDWVTKKQTIAPPKTENTNNTNNAKESVFAELKKKIVQMSKQAKDNDTGKKEQLEKFQFYQEKQRSMKDPLNYVYAVIVVVILLAVFFFVYKRVKNADVDPRLLKKKQKSKKE